MHVKELEEIGRRLDAELKKLLEFLENEVRPTTERKTAEALRKAARTLDRAARQIESRMARERR